MTHDRTKNRRRATAFKGPNVEGQKITQTQGSYTLVPQSTSSVASCPCLRACMRMLNGRGLARLSANWGGFSWWRRLSRSRWTSAGSSRPSTAALCRHRAVRCLRLLQRQAADMPGVVHRAVVAVWADRRRDDVRRALQNRHVRFFCQY